MSSIKLYSRFLIASNKVFNIYFDSISDINKNIKVDDYVSIIPKYTSVSGYTGVAVLPVINDSFGLIRVFRHPLRKLSWEVPKGFIDQDETPLVAVCRELKEEINLIVKSEDLHELCSISPEPGVLAVRVKCFFIKLDIQSFTLSGDNTYELGHEKIHFFSRNQLIALINKGLIEDACSLTTILMYLNNVST